MPDSIHSDQGRNFESKIFSEMCQLLSINKTRTSAYHPEGNGQVENLHKTLRSILKKLKSKVNQLHEDERLDFYMMAYRSGVHSSTGHNPFELMFGREMRIPLDVMVGGAENNECSYTDFVTDLEEDPQTAYRDVRQILRWPGDARRMPMTRE